MRHKHSVTDDSTKLAGVALIAALIGAITALLFTPRNGQQVRGGVKRRANAVKEKMYHNVEEVGDITEDAKDRVKETIDTAVENAQEVRDDAASNTKATKKRIEKAIDDTDNQQ